MLEQAGTPLEVTHSTTPCWSEGLGLALVLATGACGDLGVRGAVSLSHTLPMTPVLCTMFSVCGLHNVQSTFKEEMEATGVGCRCESKFPCSRPRKQSGLRSA